MKKYLQIILMIAAIGPAVGIYCSAGTCEYNVITQIDNAVAESGNAQICASGLDIGQSEALIQQIQTNCVRPPHPKGWGMLRAARPHARFYGIQKSSSLRCPDPLDPHD